MRKMVLGGIRIYRSLAPWVLSFGGLQTFSGCRFPVSCSRFAEEAISRHGLIRGGTMALERLAHCHPWSGRCLRI
ncbi:MAG: membrane protein insertion efficiency factor YidD [Patescibacteria group bacterium]